MIFFIYLQIEKKELIYLTRNEIVNNIFESIDIIVDQKLKKLKLDRTITCQLYSHIPNSDGSYELQYQDLRFRAFPIGEHDFITNAEKYDYRLQVLIPENDFRNKKYIIGVAKKLPNGNTNITENQLEIATEGSAPAPDTLTEIINILELLANDDLEGAKEKINELKGGNE